MRRKKNRGCFSYLLIMIISAVAALIIAGAFEDHGIDIPDGSGDIYLDVDNGTDDSEDDGSFDYEDNGIGNVLYAYYDQLSAVEKNIYDAICSGIKDGDGNFTFKDVVPHEFKKQVNRAITAITYDHPELFWVNGGYYISTSRVIFEEKADIEIELMYYEYWEHSLDKKKKINALNERADYVASLALELDSDFERIKFVHDYLIKNAIYDYDDLAEAKKTIHDASAEYIYSPYGCLVNGRTVCSGYAKAFQLIMQKLGYNCMYVVGDAGGPHAWNCIFIEDEGYYLDITWDDPDHKYDEPVYDYFCITSDSLEKTHELDTEFETPNCYAKTYNYFEYSGFRLDRYDFDDFCDAVDRQQDQHVINVQFGSLSELGKACKDLMDRGNIYDVPALEDESKITYSINEDHYTLTVYVD